MPGKVKVNVQASDGTDLNFTAPAGISVMVAIRGHGGLFIEDCCRGTMKCTTCHVYVDPAWHDRTGGDPCEVEQDMFDIAMGPRDASRLSCQITLTGELDGVRVEMPVATVNRMFGEVDPTGLGRGPQQQ